MNPRSISKGGAMDEWQVLTVEQVAERVQLSTSTVMRAIHAGELEASQLTRNRGGWRIRETAIEAWLDFRSNRQRGPATPAARQLGPAVAPSSPHRRSSSPSERIA